MAIFDGTTAIIGGRNIAREYMGPTPYPKRWRDFGAVIEGPGGGGPGRGVHRGLVLRPRQPPEKVRADAQAAAPRSGACELQVVASGPDVPGDPLYEGIVAMIQQAERNIWIVTPTSSRTTSSCAR
jgi:cardiolipin synthase A/B